MKKKLFDSKINLAIVISLFLLVVLGCQPAGGDLLPVADGATGTTTTRFENDTAQITMDGLSLKLSGEWTENGYVQLMLDLKNETGRDIKINFGDFRLEDGKQKRVVAGIVNDKIRSSSPSDKVVTVAAGERGVFGVEFSSPFGGSLPADEAEQMLYFILPVEINGTPKINQEIKVVFKAIDKR